MKKPTENEKKVAKALIRLSGQGFHFGQKVEDLRKGILKFECFEKMGVPKPFVNFMSLSDSV